MQGLSAVARGTRRLMAPEGLLFAALILLGAPEYVRAAMTPFLPLGAAVVAGVGLVFGWRFGRGRLVLGLLVLSGGAALSLLPPGPARSLGTLLVPIDLALLALLPDRGIGTRGGMVRLGALLLQAAAVAVMALASAPGAPNPLASVTLPALGAVDSAVALHALALVALATRSLVGGDAPARGLLWATAAALAVHLGHPAEPLYLWTAGMLMLVVAAMEDAYALAYRDALTGLPSRRALDELLDRTARRYTLAMVDVDHFKRFNDRHGHDVGDQVLRMVATRLDEVGGGARAFRYGGEEFTLVFRGRTLEEVRPLLEEARAAVESSTFALRSPDRPKKKPRRIIPPRRPVQTLKVTVSIGAAERARRSDPADEVIRSADQALYRAKKAGRNRVTV